MPTSSESKKKSDQSVRRSCADSRNKSKADLVGHGERLNIANMRQSYVLLNEIEAFDGARRAMNFLLLY